MPLRKIIIVVVQDTLKSAQAGTAGSWGMTRSLPYQTRVFRESKDTPRCLSGLKEVRVLYGRSRRANASCLRDRHFSFAVSLLFGSLLLNLPNITGTVEQAWFRRYNLYNLCIL